MKPLISIVIPVYNVKPYLQRCLHSVLTQSYQDLEILLVDDGSTDGSSRLCDHCAALDRRVTVLRQPNAGLSAARNTGLDRAHGDLIAFVDGDDWIENDMMENLARSIQLHDSDIAVCGVYIVKDDEILPHSTDGLSPRYDCRGAMAILAEDSELHSWVWNKMYRKALFSQLRFPENRLFEDYHIMHHLFHRADCVSVCGQFGYYYLQREGSIMNSQSLHRLMEFCDCRLARMHFFQHHYPELAPIVEESLVAELQELFRYADANPLHFLEEGADRLPFYRDLLAHIEREQGRKARKEARPQGNGDEYGKTRDSQKVRFAEEVIFSS